MLIHVVFFTQIISYKVIDTSALQAYYRGSRWANKLYSDQK